MQKKLWPVLTLIVLCFWAEALPAKLGTLDFDKLDTNLDDLKYEVEEEDLGDYSLVDAANNNNSVKDKSKTNVKTSGFKKKGATNKGLKSEHNIQDLKKFFKAIAADDQGVVDDDEVYAAFEGLAAEAVGAKGKEERKYKKGTKTRGFHRVHHKDEYEKDKEFYDDDERTGTIQKVGGKAIGYKIGGGAGFNKGHFHHGHRKGIIGKRGYFDKGFSDKEYSGFSDDQGFDGSYSHESE